MSPRPSSLLASSLLASTTVIGAVLAASVLGAGCGEPYHPPESKIASFVLPGKHSTLSCEECHGPPPFGVIPWGEAQCNSCHEPDRKKDPAVPPDPNYHYVPQSCGAAGCHLDTHPTWAEVVGNVDHDFLPLEGVHDKECTACHSSATPSNDDVFPETGSRYSCAGCHDVVDPKVLGAQADRDPADHWVEPGLDLPAGALLGWDCNICHDTSIIAGVPITGWGTNRDHGLIRFPHGTETAGVVLPPAAWVVNCVDCHPDILVNRSTVYQCTEACHAGIFVEPRLAFHTALVQGDPTSDATCTGGGCHYYADIRTTPSGVGVGDGGDTGP